MEAVHHDQASREAALRELTRTWPTRTLSSGEVLWYQDDDAEEVAFIEEGTLEVLLSSATVALLEAGELIGEASAFMAVAARTATLRAKGNAVIRTCTIDAVRAMRETAPGDYDTLMGYALRSLAERMHRTGERLTRLAEGDEDRPEQGAPEPVGPVHQLDQHLHRHAARLALRSLPTVDGDDDLIEVLSDLCTSRTLAAGETLLLEGDTGRTLFLLADGTLELRRNIGTDRAVTVTELRQGATVGLLGLLLGTPRNASAIATKDCWVLALPLDAHDSLQGDLGRRWREVLLICLREAITNANDHITREEQRRAARIHRDFLVRDEVVPGKPPVWPPRPSEREQVSATATRILHQIARHRRLLPDSGPCAETPCEACFSLHRPKVERAVAAGKPIHFILPAFPAKSPNQETKVIGRLPDMAEEQALRYLHDVCAAIGEIYEPGARATICSDGRVFSDLVLVTDEDITNYGFAIEEMIARLGFDTLDTFNLEDLFEVTTFEGMRDHLAVHYGEPIEQLRQKAKEARHHRAMYNGIHRFLFEDTLAVHKDKSRSKIRKECSGRAYGVIQRSNAFSRLIAECFPHSLRLSIHPQLPHATKIGILLGEAEGCWITPWHGVALKRGDSWLLTKRSRAEELGATLIEREGRPSHYELPEA